MNRFVVGQRWQGRLDGEIHHLRVREIKEDGRVAVFFVAKLNQLLPEINRANVPADWVMVEEAKPNHTSEYDPYAPHTPQGGPASQHKSDYDPFAPGRD